MNWTPRPPAAGEPVCWSWPVPPLRDRDAVLDQMVAEQAAKPLDNRLPRSALELTLHSMSAYRTDEFHAGRCAMCGAHATTASGLHLVDDHDHLTGMVRGRLCRGCNIREGVSWDDLFERYREHHPAEILGVVQYYTGYGWPFGWWRNERLARRLTANPGWRYVQETR